MAAIMKYLSVSDEIIHILLGGVVIILSWILISCVHKFEWQSLTANKTHEINKSYQ